MTDKQDNKDAETLLKAIVLRIESKGNRSFHDANMLQELRLVVEKLNEKMSQHKEEEIADKVTNQNNNRYKGILPELTIEQRENQRKAKKMLLDMIAPGGCLAEDYDNKENTKGELNLETIKPVSDKDVLRIWNLAYKKHYEKLAKHRELINKQKETNMTSIVNTVNECNKAICSISGRLFMANLSLNQELIATDPVLSSELEKASLEVNKAKGFIEEIAKYVEDIEKRKFPNAQSIYNTDTVDKHFSHAEECLAKHFSHAEECLAKCEQSMIEALAKVALVQVKPELLINSVYDIYDILLEDRTVIKEMNNAYEVERTQLLQKNSEQITGLWKTKFWADNETTTVISK